MGRIHFFVVVGCKRGKSGENRGVEDEADSMKISYDGDDKLCEEQKTKEKLEGEKFQGFVLASEGCCQQNCAQWQIKLCLQNINDILNLLFYCSFKFLSALNQSPQQKLKQRSQRCEIISKR